MEAKLHAAAPGAQVAQAKMNALAKLNAGMRGEGAAPTSLQEMLQSGMDIFGAWGKYQGAKHGGKGWA